ncbi:MAG: glycolate oxidase subunit GlcF, partial [Halioglobus sp.]
THLDRCLTCRSCETTCPSGMEYGHLIDIGRGLVEQEVRRTTTDRASRWLLRSVLSRPRLFAIALTVGQTLRPLLPSALRTAIPPRQRPAARPTTQHARTMLVLEGCAQSAATPNTNAAARRVLDKLGITLIAAPRAGCCGAVNYHLGAHADGLDNMRRNIDAWWPHIENGIEAIVNSASGCGSLLAQYGQLLSHDPAYAQKARRVSELNRDIGEVLLREDLGKLGINTAQGKIAVHTPCTLQHALALPELVSDLLLRAGFDLAHTTDGHLCCGSAGTYSVLQAAASKRLREKKLAALTGDAPALIATANVGCQLHMQAATAIPVVHWIELLDAG